jgi:hypothetical protein
VTVYVVVFGSLVIVRLMFSHVVFTCIYALQYHPDVNKQAGAEEKFKEISNAYEVRLQLPFPCLLLLLLFALI